MTFLRKSLFAFLILAGFALGGCNAARAEKMRFTFGSDTPRCNDASCAMWINARGVITNETPADFIAFIDRNALRAKTVRFDSPGGDLVAGMRLGEVIRVKKFDTEAITCASACAYAFLGGVQRRFAGKQTRFGVHRFYRSKPRNPTLRHYSGEDLDTPKRLMAGLMLYAMKMGVDLRLLAMATEAGPGEMRWIDADEARTLNVTYTPYTWDRWEIKPLGKGIIAISQNQDKNASMQIACTKSEGAYFLIRDERENAGWFRQCQATRGNGHPILGTLVGDQDVVTRTSQDKATIAFFIDPRKVTFSNATVFADPNTYGPSCIAPFDKYVGATAGLKEAAQLALRNCVE
jgi:hypothetical protein